LLFLHSCPSSFITGLAQHVAVLVASVVVVTVSATVAPLLVTLFSSCSDLGFSISISLVPGLKRRHGYGR
jgi:hypothetical protein